jgi:zinc transport system ATP-binding protein
MNNNFVSIIKRIIVEQGEAVLANAARTKGYVADYASQESKVERLAFSRCIEYGAYNELKNAQDREAAKAALARRVNAGEGIELRFCNEVLDALEAALFDTALGRQTRMPEDRMILSRDWPPAAGETAARGPRAEDESSGEPLVAVSNAAFGYNGYTVVRGLTFTVPSGGYLCIVGENGSGKSTLLKGLLGLISPMEGSLNLGEGIRRNEIGYLSQQAAAKKDFPAGVYEIVLSGFLGAMGLRPFYSRSQREAALENMRRLGIGDLRERCFRELSGGQQRRVLLARALCASRRLLALDEPAAGLDPLVTAGVYELLDKLNREMGVTVVIVSHDIESAVKYAHKILHLKKSETDGVNSPVFFGSAHEYLDSGAGREFYVRPAL